MTSLNLDQNKRVAAEIHYHMCNNKQTANLRVGYATVPLKIVEVFLTCELFHKPICQILCQIHYLGLYVREIII